MSPEVIELQKVNHDLVTGRIKQHIATERIHNIRQKYASELHKRIVAGQENKLSPNEF